MRSHGFSLIELIIVMVILGVIGVGFTSMFTQSIEQYIDGNRRSELSSSARSALERITREVRDASPNSVRVSANGQCVEFRPVASGQIYLNIPLAVPSTSFEAVTFTLPAGSWSAAIMPLSVAEQYDNSASTNKAVVPITGVSAPTANVVTVTLSNANAFPRTSSSQRFFLTGGPISFCVFNQELRRYSSYPLLPVQFAPSPGFTGALMARNIVNTTNSFKYTNGTLERNALLQMNFSLRIGDEQLSYSHEALIRNVP